jgi:thioredoxin 1
MALQLTQENFEKEILSMKGVALVDFWAPWCGPCRMLAPVIDELAKDFDGKVKIAKMNVDDNGYLAQQYNIMSIPTLLIFKDGKPVDQLVGLQAKERLADKLNAQLK